jgi:hypothetical protein
MQTIQMQLGSARGAAQMALGFINDNNASAAKMAQNDILRILDKLDQNIDALNAYLENMEGK